MSENYKTFDTIIAGQLGNIDVTGWRIYGDNVTVNLDGGAVGVSFGVNAMNARALGEQLIAAADYAEGK